MYNFLRAPIPVNLKIFLESIMDSQGFSMLPFQLPDVMGKNDLEVEGDEVYADNNQDLYFMRGGVTSILEAIIYISIFTVMNLLVRNMKCKGKIHRILFQNYLAKFFANCVLCLQGLQLVFVFSAAATATSRHFSGWEYTLNYSTAVMFITIFFSVPLATLTLLPKYKRSKEVDTEDIYPGIEKERRGAEIYTLLRIMGLLCVATTIPLFHYLVTVSMAVIFFSSQIHLIIYRNLFKFRVVKWLRVLHTLSFIAFNLIYVVYFVIDRCYPDLDVDVKLLLGNVSISCLISIYVLDVFQAFIDIGDKIYQKVILKFFKGKRCCFGQPPYKVAVIDAVQNINPTSQPIVRATHTKINSRLATQFKRRPNILDMNETSVAIKSERVRGGISNQLKVEFHKRHKSKNFIRFDNNTCSKMELHSVNFIGKQTRTKISRPKITRDVEEYPSTDRRNRSRREISRLKTSS